MTKDFFSEVAERRADAIAALDHETFAPLIRNHLVQLFRKAHTKDHGLTGCIVGMGVASATGRYLLAERDEEGKIQATEARDYRFGGGAPMYQEVADFLLAVKGYCERLCDTLPYINDITLADLETTRAKKVKIYGPQGSRSWGRHASIR